MDAKTLRDFFFSAEINDLPRLGEAASLDSIIREICIRGIPKKGFNRETILSSEMHQSLVAESIPSMSDVRSNYGSIEDQHAALKEIANSVKQLAELRLNIIMTAVSCVEENGEIFQQCVCRHFVGYKKNRDWLTQAANRARSEIAAILAPQSDMYEDDESLLTAIDLCLYRFPIKAALENKVVTRTRNDGAEFERSAATTLSEFGYEVQQIGATGDQGADILANKDGLSYAVQCKDYSGNVGNAAVQQSLSAKLHYKSDYAVVCTNNGYTKSARELAASTGVILVTKELLPQIDSLRKLVD